MSSPKYGVVAIGNALVDVLSHVSEDIVKNQCITHGIAKGTMGLIDETRAVEMYTFLEDQTETSGGSAANTMAGFASFGGTGGFIGKVGNDDLGNTFKKDLKTLGITFQSLPLIEGPQTGRCMVLITPDAQRTMNTYLGAALELTEKDVDESLIADAQITYLEGYLFNAESTKRAFIHAAEAAHKAGRKVAFTLSDPFCVDMHRDSFKQLVENHVDILFANEDEIKSLYQTETFEDAANQAAKHVDIAALTRSEKGAVIYANNEQITIPAQPVNDVIDTTGAGDQFAAGFLYGHTQNMPLAECGKLGTIAAAEVISHTGPRPLVNLAELAKKTA